MAMAGPLCKTNNSSLASLRDYVADTVSANYDLVFCLDHSIGFHHGKMPQHVRNAVEFAVGKGMLTTVVCTTTLMQGVNIPAKSVVLRNPNLFLKKTNGVEPKLSAYEIANLRGRAGRLLRDFVGRTIILDGSEFETPSQQIGLFEPTVKQLDASYGGVFKKNREMILDETIADENKKRSGISKYIRSVMYTEPDAAGQLARRGIYFSSAEVERIKGGMLRLDVDKSICRRYRYWDPYDLQTLRDLSRKIDLPMSPFDDNVVNRLASVLDKVSQAMPSLVGKFLGSQYASNSRKRWVLCKSAVGWAREKPLSELLAVEYIGDSSDKTEDCIAMLQNTVAYGLPALLYPLYTLGGKKEFLLSAMERGAYSKANITLLNNNIPRETALTFSDRARKFIREDDSISQLCLHIPRLGLGFWDRIQFRHLASLGDIQ